MNTETESAVDRKHFEEIARIQRIASYKTEKIDLFLIGHFLETRRQAAQRYLLCDGTQEYTKDELKNVISYCDEQIKKFYNL